MDSELRAREVLVDPSADPSVAAAKKRQNGAFRMYGGISVALGYAGFTPSIGFALTGVLWSVSHNDYHTDVDIFLWVHVWCMVLWFVSVGLQLWTGGTPRSALHRAGGYVGWLALTLGQLVIAVWTVKYDFAEGQWAGGVYTLTLVVMAVFNINIGCLRARQKRFMEHKDHVLMALMWSLDPGFHRLAMWAAHLASGHLDPVSLLEYAKLPANFTLVCLFGAMVVSGRRANCITVPNIGLQFVAFHLGALAVFTDASSGKAEAAVWIATACGAVLLCAIVAAFSIADWRLRRTPCQR